MSCLAETNVTPSTNEPVVRSSAAERMRLHREFRREGMRCLWIELHATEIDSLIQKGGLQSGNPKPTGAGTPARIFAWRGGSCPRITNARRQQRSPRSTRADIVSRRFQMLTSRAWGDFQ